MTNIQSFYKDKVIVGFGVGVFLLCLGFFLYIYMYIHTDIQLHSAILEDNLEKGLFPVPPLYYFTIHSLRLLLGHLGKASIVVLSTAVALKYLISIKISSEFRLNKFATLLFLFFILFITPININIESNFLLGKLGINIWHNSTTIFLMPFALLLYYVSYLTIKNDIIKPKYIWLMCILILVNSLSKPSFLFVFIPVFPLMTILFSKNDLQKVVLAFCMSFYSGLLVVLEYLYIYVKKPTQDDGSVAFSFMYILKLYSNNIPLDMLTSMLLPLVILILFFKKTIKNKMYIYAVLLFVVAVLIFLFVQETGDRANHGNFVWQVIVCNYILFLISTFIGLEHISEKGWKDYKSILFLVTFLLHLVSGILYLFKIIAYGQWV
ncbi:hypothetical protein [Bernardetia sp.]|uniref:hypothetical protein n=1 Tax=Bernardetia sp. TaxID=1937974 RepID=UPI0025C193F3|nr:hypothetical protein [Bernardetia sp.]